MISSARIFNTYNYISVYGVLVFQHVVVSLEGIRHYIHFFQVAIIARSIETKCKNLEFSTDRDLPKINKIIFSICFPYISYCRRILLDAKKTSIKKAIRTEERGGFHVHLFDSHS